MRIDPVGVVGLGLLGRGIAASLVGAGVHVVAFDTSEQARQEAFSFIENAVQEMVRHGVLAQQTAAAWPEHLTFATRFPFSNHVLLSLRAFTRISLSRDTCLKNSRPS